MRTLPEGVISQKLGLEPYNLVAVKWSGSRQTFYSDISEGNGDIPGTLISLSGLENVTNLSNSSSVGTVSVVISDIDGSLKNIYDTIDIHQRPAQIFQAFHGESGRFLIFEGVVSSNIVWDEGEETLSFDIISKTSTHEVGFSPEEAVFKNLDFSLVGKPWPIHFGTVRYKEPVRLTNQPTGLILTPIGIPDYGILEQIWRLLQQINDIKVHVDDILVGGTTDTGLDAFNDALKSKAAELQAAVDQAAKERARIQAQIVDLQKLYAEQKEYFKPSLSFQSEYFPTGSRDVLINNVLYAVNIKKEKAPDTYSLKFVKGIMLDVYEPTEQDYKEMVDKTVTSSGGADKLGFQYLNVGTSISLVSDYDYAYLVSACPCTITEVSAYKTISGIRKLLTIPAIWRLGKLSTLQGFSFSASSYTITEEGNVPKVVPAWLDPVVIILKHNLNNLAYKKSDYGKTIEQKNPDTWDEQIFVSTKGGIGKDVIDVMKWTIKNFTNLTFDSTSFSKVQNIVKIYPVGFVLEDKRNALQFLQDLATQIRSSIWIKDGKVYIRYLADEPTPIATITEDDIQEKSLKLMTTDTQSIVTKYTATYRLNYLPETGESKVIIRNNIDKYGTFEESFNYFAFNIHYVIKKMATYWLLRKSNTWKRITFKTFLTKLNVEAMDCVNIQFANTKIFCKGLVESATYDSESNTVEMTVLLPILVGNTKVSPLYWPSTLSAQTIEQRQKEMTVAGGNSGFSPTFNKATVSVPPEGSVTIYEPKFPEETDKWFFNPFNKNKQNPFSSLSISDDSPLIYLGDVGQQLPIESVYSTQTFDFTPKTTPVFNYKLNDAPAEVTSGGRSKSANNIYPGKVLEKTGGNFYSVRSYPFGLDDDSKDINAKQLQIAEDDELVSGTWVLVAEVINTDNKKEYYIQAPVWN